MRGDGGGDQEGVFEPHGEVGALKEGGEVLQGDAVADPEGHGGDVVEFAVALQGGEGHPVKGEEEEEEGEEDEEPGEGEPEVLGGTVGPKHTLLLGG
jgi:hypothetical protein